MSADRTAASSPGNQGKDTQITYDVRAPDGGLRQQVEGFMGDDARCFIDLVISAKPGHLVHVRMYPDRDTVFRDSSHANLIHFSAGTCFALVQGEEVGPPLMCSGRVNLQVTSAPWEAGKLGILFEQGDPL